MSKERTDPSGDARNPLNQQANNRTKKNQNTFVFWFFFLSARWKGLEQGGGAQRRKQSARWAVA